MSDDTRGPSAPMLAAPATSDLSTDLAGLRSDLSPSLRILLDPRLYAQIKLVAGVMAADTVGTPKHLQGKPQACHNVINQALDWNLSPYFVARGTYMTPGGSIGYMGFLIQAILEQTHRFIGAPKFQYIGDWRKLVGKFEKKIGKSGGEYTAPTWTDRDADGLGIIVSWRMRDEDEPRVWPGKDEPFWLVQCFPRNSPLWGTDARTQISYLGIRRFANLACPGVLGGVPFDHDEYLDASERARDVTPPPRPQRSDAKYQDQTPPATTEVSTSEDTVEIVDADGEHHEVLAVNALAEMLDVLREAQKLGRERLRATWEDNADAIALLSLKGGGRAQSLRDLRHELWPDESTGTGAQTTSPATAEAAGEGIEAKGVPDAGNASPSPAGAGEASETASTQPASAGPPKAAEGAGGPSVRAGPARTPPSAPAVANGNNKEPIASKVPYVPVQKMMGQPANWRLTKEKLCDAALSLKSVEAIDEFRQSNHATAEALRQGDRELWQDYQYVTAEHERSLKGVQA
jgi:RecT family protein